MNFKHLFVIFVFYISYVNGVPRVSIITSVYNGDMFIEGFMADIVRQTIFNQCELIMINANSPGNEESVIKQYMEKYSNIIYVKLDHDPGLYGVWNMAIRMSTSELITNANLDDRLKADSIEVHAESLEANPEIDLVYSNNYITKVANSTFENPNALALINYPEFSRKAMLLCLPDNHPMWRKSIHERFGFFESKYKATGDFEMWLRAVEKGSQFLKILGIYGLFYFSKNNLSQNSKYSFEIVEILNKYKQVFGMEHLSGWQLFKAYGKAWSEMIQPMKTIF
jgi:glycosyltransferase involved in cell wall biosynthesis